MFLQLVGRSRKRSSRNIGRADGASQIRISSMLGEEMWNRGFQTQ